MAARAPWHRPCAAWCLAWFAALAAGAAYGASATTEPVPAPRRIVSIAPHATELLFSAGVGDRVVADSEASDYPEATRSLPKVSSYRGSNVEAIAALKPDLVVVWPSGNRPADIAALQRLGIRVYASELDTLESIIAEQRHFGSWVEDPARRAIALREADAAAARLAALRERYRSARRVRVFYQLGVARLFTLSDRHVIGQALDVCGADNVFGALSVPAPEVSAEAVLAARPDAVVVADAKALAAARRQWNEAKLYPAAQISERVVAADGERLHRPTLRTFAAVDALCRAIDAVRSTLR